MELLYFISGILTVGVTYGIILLRKNQNNYHDALARLQHHQNISSIREGNIDSHRVVEAEFQNVKNEIHSIKMNIKALNDDPNFLSRYS